MLFANFRFCRLANVFAGFGGCVAISVYVLRCEDDVFFKAEADKASLRQELSHIFSRANSLRTQSNFGCSRVRSLKCRNIECVGFNREFNVFLRQPRQRQRGQVVKFGSQNLTAVEAPGSILQTEYRLHRKQIFDPGAPLRSKHLLLQICLKLLPEKRAKVGPLFHPQQNVDAAELNKWRLST